MIQQRLWPISKGVAVLLSLFAGWPGVAVAQVIYDGKLSRGSLNGPNFEILEAHGTRPGGSEGPNLFHGFAAFDLGRDQTAIFSGSANIRNIFARVTSGQQSTIDGTVRSTINGAALYLLNPAGILFGANARVDVPGAFTATTADFIELADGVRFQAEIGPSDDLLTAAPPAAFGFLPGPPGAISVEARNLIARPGAPVALVGGDITLAEDSSIVTEGGDLSLISVGSPMLGNGRVTLHPAAPGVPAVASGFASLGSVALQRGASLRATSPVEGGRVVIRAGRLTMENAAIENDVAGTGSNRGVDIAVSGTFTLADSSRVTALIETGGSKDSGGVKIEAEGLDLGPGSTIDTANFGIGTGGLLQIRASRVEIDGGNSGGFTGLFAESDNTGPARGIKLDVAGSLEVRGGGLIRSNTFGPAPAGPVRISAGTATFDGTGINQPTGVQASAFARGSGGPVEVAVVGALTLRGGAEFTASTNGPGASGSLDIHSGSILLDGVGTDRVTGFTVESLAASGGGNAGTLRVETSGALHIQGTGIISGGTFGEGDGGPVSVCAGEISIERRGSVLDFIGITALSRMKPGEGRGGRAGNIDVQVEHALTLRDGGLIDSSTFGTGAAGSVSVTAGSIAIDRAGSEFFTGIGSDTEAPRGAGAGGNVIVISRSRLTLDRGGLISTGTFGGGPAGIVSVVADQISIQGRGTLNRSVVSEFSGIIAGTAAGSSGSGGSVSVRADQIDVRDHGLIGAATRGSGAGGDVSILGGVVTLASRGQIAASTVAAGRGGSVRLRADRLQLRDGAAITASATETGFAGSIVLTLDGPVSLTRGSKLAVTSLQTDAGQIELRTPDRVALRDSAITAEAAGNGGSIVLAAGFLELDSSRITANAVAGDGGLITLNVPATGVLGDPGDFVIVSDFVRQSADSRITASSQQGVQGALRISAPELDLSNSVEALSAALLDASAQLREQCARRLNADFSSFLILGRGGVAESPEDAQASGGGRRRFRVSAELAQ